MGAPGCGIRLAPFRAAHRPSGFTQERAPERRNDAAREVLRLIRAKRSGGDGRVAAE